MNKEKFFINICIINMKSNYELKETVSENRMCYYFDDIIKTEDLVLIMFILMKNHIKIF